MKKSTKDFDYNSSHSYDYALNARVYTWQSTMGFDYLV